MYITFTEEELKQIQAIKDSYTPKREQLQRDYTILMQGKDDPEKRHEILIQQQAVIDSLNTELLAYYDKLQRLRFAPVRAAGAKAIINHAKEQIPLILEEVHKEVKQEYKDVTADALKEMKIGTLKDGELLLSANYAAQALKEELKLHITALNKNKTALQELLETIIEAAEVSGLTDNADILDGQAPLGVKRFRRNPLGEIISYGIMNDKVNAQLMQDGDIFQQTANGQLTLRWAVNQAPQKKEAVPVYMALTYEGTEVKTTKKLTAFDKQVCEAVSTRFYYWQLDNPQKPLYITPQEIWRTMNGKASKDGQAKPSPAQVKRICDSLDKMRFTRFYMDISAEIEAFNLSIDDERVTGGRIETYVLNSSKVEFTTDKGNIVQGYRIGEEPILYTYNKAKNHLLYVPYEMLDTSGYISDSENVAEFKGYLLQQIFLMKNAADEGKKGKRFKRNSIILLETLYRDTGIQPPEERITGKEYKTEASRQKEIRRFRQADRQKIEGLLKAWKKKKLIKDYAALNQNNEPLKEKQQAKGYRIDI